MAVFQLVSAFISSLVVVLIQLLALFKLSTIFAWSATGAVYRSFVLTFDGCRIFLRSLNAATLCDEIVFVPLICESLFADFVIGGTYQYLVSDHDVRDCTSSIGTFEQASLGLVLDTDTKHVKGLVLALG